MSVPAHPSRALLACGPHAACCLLLVLVPAPLSLLHLPLLFVRGLACCRHYIRLNALFDDGAVVYLNGVEVWRVNMARGAVGFRTLALRRIDGRDETIPSVEFVSMPGLVQGLNTLAVEVSLPACLSGVCTWLCACCVRPQARMRRVATVLGVRRCKPARNHVCPLKSPTCPFLRSINSMLQAQIVA